MSPWVLINAGRYNLWETGGNRMLGPAEIGGAISGLKGLLDIAKGLKAVNDEVTINEVKIALQGAVLEAQSGLLAAQSAQATHLSRITELEQEIMRLKDWSTQRESYELVAINGGGFAYMLKAGMQGSQPAHWLCANCFDQGRKSYLQNKGQTRPGRGDLTIGCDGCKGSFSAPYGTRPAYRPSS